VLAFGALDAVNFRLNQISGAVASSTYGPGGKDSVSHSRKFDYNA